METNETLGTKSDIKSSSVETLEDFSEESFDEFDSENDIDPSKPRFFFDESFSQFIKEEEVFFAVGKAIAFESNFLELN